MNFKTKSFVALLIISVFLLSNCEVYKTLYGTGTEKPAEMPVKEAGKVVRVEGENAKSPETLAKAAYSSAIGVSHDPFKIGQNPLGPFDEGKSLGFTFGQWLEASGIGIYSVKDDESASLDLSFKKLVSNGIYTVWCSRVTFPPEPKFADMPCGKEDGSENMFTADEKGNGYFSVNLRPLEGSTKETGSLIAIAYHSDGKTYGASPGDFGANSHVQLFYLMPEQSQDKTSFEVPIKFVNHIDAGFPEQDVFVEVEQPEKEETQEKPQVKESEEKEEETPSVTGEVVKTEEPVMEEKPKEKPIVVIVQETDLVSLVPNAEDPDSGTSLIFTFTSPLNEKGEWQTTYGDSGEYTVTVTASDGESITSRDVLVIVNKKEETPTIDSSRPIESGLKVDETQAVEFRVDASDLNKDPLTYAWKLDGVDAGDEDQYTYLTTYDDAGSHTVKVDVSDGISAASKIWSVDVSNVNRKPLLEKMNDITAKETDKIVITALATDDDNDEITYSISDDRFSQEDNVFTLQTDYSSAGTYDVTVTANDGQDSTEQSFTVNVENVNRPPVIKDIGQKK